MPQNHTDAPLDGQLELKKRARRRLVGAAALALLAAVILPMVMDHEPRQPAQDVQISIPSQDDRGLATRVLTGKPAATPLPPDVAAKAEPKPEVKSAPKPDDAHPGESGAGETKAATKPEPAPAPKTEEKPVVKPTEKPVSKPADKPAVDKAEEAKARAALAGANPDDGEAWVVQLGAYKEEGRVKGLVAKVKQLGLPVYTESVETPQGERMRVRAGPFKTREAADKARERIGKIGVDGPVARK